MHTSNRILIINGDDFGVSPTVNAAVIRAHTEGVLTSASLLVNARASSEAVTVARAYPHLGVGLHITLVREKATLSVEKPSTLVDQTGHFPQNPVIAGLRYFFDSGIKLQLAREIEAQIQKFMATGMTPSHVDGHLNMHMHPTVLTILLPLARKYAIPAFRLPRENLWINLKLCPRNIWSKSLHWFIYFCLCTHAKRTLMTSGIAFPDRFFGLLASGHLDEAFLLGVIDNLKNGVTEIGVHPALSVPPEVEKWAPHYEYLEEFKALVSPKLKQRIQTEGIQLTNYHALSRID